MRKPVTTPDQVVSNLRNFSAELSESKELQSKLGHAHAWYALRVPPNGWLFGPSKFVGYPDNTARAYLASYRKTADGRETEKALAKWFPPVDRETRLGRELYEALEEFLAGWGRNLRQGARVSVVSVEGENDVRVPRPKEAQLNRISADPRICGGRPRIKGTRVRVSDIVDMLAAGASRGEILNDYPYLVDEDIAAALAYAARATDHRTIRAA